MPIWRHKIFWAPFYVFIISFLFINFRKKAYWILLFLLLAIGTSDLISSHLIKKNVERLRPCNEPELVVTERIRCGSGYSFTSSHATNHFAIAFFLICLFAERQKWIKYLLLFWAGSISFGQVYVGVHYPLDVFCGAILGVLIGGLWASIYQRYYGFDLRTKWETG